MAFNLFDTINQGVQSIGNVLKPKGQNNIFGSPPQYQTNPTYQPQQNNEAAQAAIEMQKKQAAALAQRAQGMQQAATDFDNQMPGMIKAQYNPLADQAKMQLGQNLQGVNNQSNQRGLLYSGLRQGAQSGQISNTASQMAQAHAGIEGNAIQQSQNLQDQARQAQFQAQMGAFAPIQQAQQLTGMQQQINNNEMQRVLSLRQKAMQDMYNQNQQSAQLIGQGLGAVGQAAGKAAVALI